MIVAGRHERDDGLAEALVTAAAALGDAAAGRPALGGAPRPGGRRALRRAAARRGLRRRPSPPDRDPRRRPADLQAAAPVARRPRRPARWPSTPRPPGRTRRAVVSEVLDADPAAWARSLAGPPRAEPAGWRRGAPPTPPPRRASPRRWARRSASRPWRARWRRWRARSPSSPRSSMPVRDVESFWPVRDAPPRVLAHRGANGIDGTLAAAFGAAAAGARVVVHLGDVALAHDLGALLSATRPEARAHRRAGRQRRRRDLRLPPGRHADRRLRGARRHADRARRRARRRPLRPRPTSAWTTLAAIREAPGSAAARPHRPRPRTSPLHRRVHEAVAVRLAS